MVYNYDPETDELKINPTVKSKKCTPLMHAILKDNENLVKEILNNDLHTINTVNAKGCTALHIVARNSRSWNLFKYLSILLENGADPNIQEKNGWTALMNASIYSNKDSTEETVRILLENGANPNIQNNDGWAALMFASAYSKTDSTEETVRILLEKGANPNIQSINGWTALMLASRHSKTESSEETVRILLEYGADPKIKNKLGKDVVEETKKYFQEVEIKKLRSENESLKDRIDLLELEPIPGRNFINLYMEEFKKDDPNFTEKFIEAYIPILRNNLEDMILK